MLKEFLGVFATISIDSLDTCCRIAHDDDLIRYIYQVYVIFQLSVSQSNDTARTEFDVELPIFKTGLVARNDLAQVVGHGTPTFRFQFDVMALFIRLIEPRLR